MYCLHLSRSSDRCTASVWRPALVPPFEPFWKIDVLYKNERINITYYTKKGIKPTKKIKNTTEESIHRIHDKVNNFGTKIKVAHAAGFVLSHFWLLFETGHGGLERTFAECHWLHWLYWSGLEIPLHMKPELEGKRRTAHRVCTTSNVGVRLRGSLLLLAVLVLLAVGREALRLQQLGGSSSLGEGALVVLQESPLLLQSGFLISVEALQLLKTTLQLTHKQEIVTEMSQFQPLYAANLYQTNQFPLNLKCFLQVFFPACWQELIKTICVY